MRKKIRQHIRKRNYVTVYITDRDSTVIAHYNGVLLAQSDCLLLIGVMYDFFYDGLVLVRKRDISEIRYSKKEKFFNQVIENEGIKGEFLNKWLGFIFEMTDVARGLGVRHMLNLPVIIEG